MSAPNLWLKNNTRTSKYQVFLSTVRENPKVGKVGSNWRAKRGFFVKIFGFLNIHFVAKNQKSKRGPLETLKLFGKVLHC